jgi:protein involved in temperature-dependent protein secretion
MSRRTDWYDADGGWSLPLGQRVLVTDVEETALMDIRSLAIAPALASTS